MPVNKKKRYLKVLFSAPKSLGTLSSLDLKNFVNGDNIDSIQCSYYDYPQRANRYLLLEFVYTKQLGFKYNEFQNRYGFELLKRAEKKKISILDMLVAEGCIIIDDE